MDEDQLKSNWKGALLLTGPVVCRTKRGRFATIFCVVLNQDRVGNEVEALRSAIGRGQRVQPVMAKLLVLTAYRLRLVQLVVVKLRCCLKSINMDHIEGGSLTQGLAQKGNGNHGHAGLQLISRLCISVSDVKSPLLL